MAKSLKALTQAVTGWDSRTYDKEYRKYFNRFKNYQRTIGSTKQQNIAAEFYYTQKNIKAGRKLSLKRQLILSSTSATTTSKLSEKQLSRGQKFIEDQYAHLIKNSPYAQRIANNDDLTPDEKRRRLDEFADSLNVARSMDAAERKKAEEQGLPFNKELGNYAELMSYEED